MFFLYVNQKKSEKLTPLQFQNSICQTWKLNRTTFEKFGIIFINLPIEPICKYQGTFLMWNIPKLKHV